MKNVTYTCDRCGGQASERICMTRASVTYGAVESEHDRIVLDLCAGCVDELVAWIESKKEDGAWQPTTPTTPAAPR